MNPVTFLLAVAALAAGHSAARSLVTVPAVTRPVASAPGIEPGTGPCARYALATAGVLAAALGFALALTGARISPAGIVAGVAVNGFAVFIAAQCGPLRALPRAVPGGARIWRYAWLTASALIIGGLSA